jgi:Uma2 family endonuclease
MGTPAEELKLTYEDLLDMPEDGKRHELIDGEHGMTPSPSTRHQAVSGNLYRHLANHLSARPLGRVFAAPLDVVLSDSDVVEPDLVFISNERQEIITERNIAGAPDLVVEILSATTRRRDEVLKRRLYARFGVREYWVVDPELETARVLRRGPFGLDQVALLDREAGDALTTELLPGLEVPLDEVFR